MMFPAKNILVVGGDLIGWWAAVFLKKNIPGLDVSILNVKAKDNLAETTEAGFSRYLHLIGLTEQHIIQYADGNFCFAQAYLNWLHPQQQYFHTGEELNLECDAVEFNQWMLKLRRSGNNQKIDDYSLFAQAAKVGRSPVDLQGGIKAGLSFDVQDFKKILMSYASDLGIKKIDDEVISVDLDSDNNIAAVIISGGNSVKSDFYIDATGSQGSLIANGMGIEYESWASYLPLNQKKVVAVPPQDLRLIPFTSVHWVEQGWIKSIPLKNKVICEYVFNSSVHEKTQIDDFFADGFNIDFQPGIRKKIWHKNCLAIGSSGISIDNFNYSSFYVSVLTLNRFMEYWPSHQSFDAVEQEFNRVMGLEYVSIRDYHSLHYALIKMQKLPSNILHDYEMPASLQYRLNVYKECGRSLADENTLLHPSQWLHLLMGMDIWPKNYDYLAGHHDNDMYVQHAQRIKHKIQETLKKLPDFNSYIKTYMA